VSTGVQAKGFQYPTDPRLALQASGDDGGCRNSFELMRIRWSVAFWWQSSSSRCWRSTLSIGSEHTTGRTLFMDQPVPFSHAYHVGGLDCRYCHTSVETSPVAGIPPTHICMTCHSQLYTQTAMLAPVRESLASGKPIHWNKVNKLSDYVYFDHSIHVAKGVSCTTCHGPVASMLLMRQVAPLTMGWCLDCHRNPGPNLRPPSAVFDPCASSGRAHHDNELKMRLLSKLVSQVAVPSSLLRRSKSALTPEGAQS
jgi:Cytochrome c7 and related cytochrome c